MSATLTRRYVLITSTVGTIFGGTLLFKEYIQGCHYTKKTNLAGKTVVITGANTGIGKETAKELAKRGAKVIMACRDIEKCNQAKLDVLRAARYYLRNQREHTKMSPSVVCEELDLASFESIQKFAVRLQKESTLDILINNGASMRDQTRTLTKDGLEKQIGVNHFGHFLLTNLLLDKIKASVPSRIVTLSSSAHTRGSLDFENLNWDHDYDPGAAYNASKLANILFTRQLAKKVHGTGVVVSAVHPGLVYTDLFRNLPMIQSWSSVIFKPLMWIFFKTPRVGAQTVLYAALDENTRVNGAYYANCSEKQPSEQALDDSLAQKLWITSEKWTRLNETKQMIVSETSGKSK